MSFSGVYEYWLLTHQEHFFTEGKSTNQGSAVDTWVLKVPTKSAIATQLELLFEGQ